MSAPPSISSPNNLNNLPAEILSIILDLVFVSYAFNDLRSTAQQQLARVCRVSHSLLPVARDRLYHTIHFDLNPIRLTSWSQLTGGKGYQPLGIDHHPAFPIIRTLVNHPHLGSYIREVALFKLPARASTVTDSEELPELAQLLELCPYLEAVQMTSLARLGLELGGIVAPFNTSRRKLKCLSVGDVDKAERVRGEMGLRRSLANFFDTQTEVEELSMWGVDGHLGIATDPPAWRLRKLRTHPSSFAHLAHHSKATLRHLHLSYSRRDSRKTSPLDLTAFAGLQSLHLEDHYSGDQKEVDTYRQRCFPLCPPSLTTLCITHSITAPYIAVDPLLPLLPPSLVHLDLRNTAATVNGLTNMLAGGSLPSLKTLWYARPEVPGGKAGAEHEEEERRLSEVGCKRGVRVIPTGKFKNSDLVYSRLRG